MSKPIECLYYCAEMTRACDSLDKLDLSRILEERLNDVNTVEDIIHILSEHVTAEYWESAADLFTYDEWVIYLEARYNIKFKEKIIQVLIKPDGEIKKIL